MKSILLLSSLLLLLAGCSKNYYIISYSNVVTSRNFEKIESIQKMRSHFIFNKEIGVNVSVDRMDYYIDYSTPNYLFEKDITPEEYYLKSEAYSDSISKGFILPDIISCEQNISTPYWFENIGNKVFYCFEIGGDKIKYPYISFLENDTIKGYRTEFPKKQLGSVSYYNYPNIDSVITIGNIDFEVSKIHIYTKCNVTINDEICYKKQLNNWMWIDKKLNIPVRIIYNANSAREVTITMDNCVYMSKRRQRKELKEIILNCPPDTTIGGDWNSLRIIKTGG